MENLIVFVIMAVIVLFLHVCINKNTNKKTAPSHTETIPVTEPTATESARDDSVMFIGTWESEESHLEISENGKAMYKMKSQCLRKDYRMTWELKNNQLYLTYLYEDMVLESIFTMNEEGTSLTLIKNMLPEFSTCEQVYYKQ